MIIHLNDGRHIEVEVKPCPFCGTEPEVRHQGNNHTKDQGILIRCPVCRVKRTDKVIHQDIDWIIPKALAHWNKRTPAQGDKPDG